MGLDDSPINFHDPDNLCSRVLVTHLYMVPVQFHHHNLDRRSKFYILVQLGRNTAFNHIIGLPKKNEEDKPFYNYEKLLFDTLQQHGPHNGLKLYIIFIVCRGSCGSNGW